MKNKRYLITSALPYINGVKHLGNLVGSILPADIYARFLRQHQKEVLFICGTDEHGAPAEIAAEAAHKPIAQYCEETHHIQKCIYERFSIGFDFFGRSSSPSNHKLSQNIFLHLKENGFLEEKESQQFYSPEDQRFLPDRYVEGTCPHCHFVKARGDQCDGCGALLDPQDLVDPYSALSGSKRLELKAVRHIFLNLEKIEPQIRQWLEEKTHWSDIVKGIATKWLNEGLKPRCITRDLRWGIPVPQEHYQDKVFYVWFDAPNAYISITQDWAKQLKNEDQWKEWWQNNPQEICYTQFMAKDNVPFHAIFWPAVLLSANMGFKTVDYIKSFHWLTYDKGKFSTSHQRGVFTDAALELFPADYWRYYLIANCPETADSDFTFKHFAAVINKDLADILGNFANRVLSLMSKYYTSQVPLKLTPAQMDQALLEKISHIQSQISQNLEALRFRPAAKELRNLWVLGNEYITQEQPWVKIHQDAEKAAVTLTHCVHLLRCIAIVSYPFIPETASTLLNLLNDSSSKERLASLAFGDGLNFSYFEQGHTLQAIGKLFDKIDEEKALSLEKQFAGG